jgi:hypothetical protein
MRKAAAQTAMVAAIIAGGLVMGALTPAYSQNEDAITVVAGR